MKVNEIFYSLSGEGIHVGIPTVFVRLTGCNLNCIYCDTQYAQEGGEDKTVDQIVHEVESLLYPRIPQFRVGLRQWVLITGGEPLIQWVFLRTLVRALKRKKYLVEIETNGSIDPPPWFGCIDCWSVDTKCPSSGSYGLFRTKWLRRMRKRDQLKFVVGTAKDLDFVRGFLSENNLRPTVLISPITGILLNKKKKTTEEYWNREWLQEAAEFCKEQNVRMSLQLHKVIWGDKKGV